MTTKKTTASLLLLLTLLLGCSGGYKNDHGKISYVTYDEAVGKTVHPIDADASTFTVLPNANYAKDRSKVFYECEVIETADPQSFKVINDDGYAKDANHVYLKTAIVIGAKPDKFELLKFPYAKDDKTVFCGTVPLHTQSIENFKVVES